ncbi:MAG: 2-phosphosulfolactate phosphatase [Mycetocola sp.]
MPDRTLAPDAVTATQQVQSKYQVRFDTGPGAIDRIGTVDVLVLVDALAEPADVPALADDAIEAPSRAGAVLVASLTDRSAAARWILDHQVQQGRRVSIAVVATGADGFDAPQVLAAGAVIDALITLGIDFTSPEAAVACGAFANLRNAVGHLFTASVTGQELIAAGERDRVVAAARVDTSAVARVLRS